MLLLDTVYNGDCLDVIKTNIDSESIDLIYLDPPFNTNINYNASKGSLASGAMFKDTWSFKDLDIEWIETIRSRYHKLYRVICAAMSDEDKSYLYYISIRILEMWRILKHTGSIYLHCDSKMSHYLKLVMDAIFGKNNFINEIIWCYRTGGASKKHWARKHDVILMFRKSKNIFFNPIKEKSYLSYRYGFKNVNIFEDENGFYTKINCRDWWTIEALRGNQPESLGYPTQKPVKLLARIVEASCPKNGIVMDPFCGSGTTLMACKNFGIKFIGIDMSLDACNIASKRLNIGLEV